MPVTLALPTFQSDERVYLLHDVAYREPEFVCEATADVTELTGHISLSPLFIYSKLGHVELRFNFAPDTTGAPTRPSFDLFQLTDGQWGQFKCNGRIGGTWPWHYQKTVFNVAFGRNISDDVFIASSPHKSAESMATLR